jgi:hypothetical protein
MKRMSTAVLLVAMFAGCSVGPRGETTALALSPRGALIELVTQTGEMAGELVTRTGTMAGELLEMRNDGLVLLTNTGQVTLVEYEAVRHATVEHGPPGLTGANMRSGRTFHRLRRVSRFPQGLSPEVETRLLSAYGQSALVVVRP